MGTRCDSGATDDHRLPAGMTEIHDIKSVALLRQHAASENQIGPIQVAVAQLFGIAID